MVNVSGATTRVWVEATNLPSMLQSLLLGFAFVKYFPFGRYGPHDCLDLEAARWLWDEYTRFFQCSWCFVRFHKRASNEALLHIECILLLPRHVRLWHMRCWSASFSQLHQSRTNLFFPSRHSWRMQCSCVLVSAGGYIDRSHVNMMCCTLYNCTLHIIVQLRAAH